MTTRKIILTTHEYYHVYNRGNSKQNIYKDDQDKRYFVKLLSILNEQPRHRIDKELLENAFSFDNTKKPIVAIVMYAVMDNHFHLVLKQLEDNGTSIFMQKLGTAYSMYFNKKYSRSGALFEGAFKSKHIANDDYMRYLYAYIHLNPAKLIDPLWKKSVSTKQKNVVDFIKKYPYSSFHDYCGISRPEQTILDKVNCPQYFETPTQFMESILSWIKIDPSES